MVDSARAPNANPKPFRDPCRAAEPFDLLGSAVILPVSPALDFFDFRNAGGRNTHVIPLFWMLFSVWGTSFGSLILGG